MPGARRRSGGRARRRAPPARRWSRARRARPPRRCAPARTTPPADPGRRRRRAAAPPSPSRRRRAGRRPRRPANRAETGATPDPRGRAPRPITPVGSGANAHRLAVGTRGEPVEGAGVADHDDGRRLAADGAREVVRAARPRHRRWPGRGPADRPPPAAPGSAPPSRPAPGWRRRSRRWFRIVMHEDHEQPDDGDAAADGDVPTPTRSSGPRRARRCCAPAPPPATRRR